ncbi:MAG TPA: hydrolase [Rhizomicrobium sp.]|nr:hydrolase [Rhizomicrobium sp.]
MVTVDPKSTALVLIDLQNGILGFPLAPLSGPELLNQGKALAQKFRAAGAPVVLVNVAWASDSKDVLRAPVDYPTHPEGGLPAGFSNLADGLAADGDILITKRQWGAFTGTELDLQLRRRGISTIVLGGVSTNMGVESTARQAWELNYGVVIASQATTSIDGDMHSFAMGRIFPLIARVADDIAFG